LRILWSAALVALTGGAVHASGDLDVLLVSRSPRIDYVWDAADPTRQGWPAPAQNVTWQAHVAAWGGHDIPGVSYRWILDGAEVARGRVDVAAGTSTLVDYTLPWTFERRELTFEIDPDGEVAEDEEGNNSQGVFTDALGVGFYVEQGLYDHFRNNQHLLAGGRSNSFEDWAQRHMRRFNEMAARAIWPETPGGVLDRMRLDEVVVVPDGALPLVPLGDIPTAQPEASGRTHPNLADRSVDLVWGFVTADVATIYKDVRTVDENANPFYYEGSLLHELGHARYLQDVYGWWVRDGVDGDAVNITEGGRRVAGTALMPGTQLLHFSSGQGLMTQTYGFIDHHSSIALNLIAHRRATRGNYNEPDNIGEFLNDLPAENRVTVRDAGGNPIPDADVWIYQAVGGKPYYFTKIYDDVPDLKLRTDAAGRVLVGRCPFSVDGKLVHDFGGSNVTAIVRVAKGSYVAYGFLESLGFNIEYWGGHTQLADHDLVVGKECPFSRPFLTFPAREARLPASPVTLDWSHVYGATGYELWADLDGGAARLIGTLPATKTTLTTALTGRVTWWVAAKFPGCQSMLSGFASFTVLPVASFEYAPATPQATEPVDFFGHADGGPASFAWSFGDGGTSSAARPSHAYAAPGSYDVTLTVTTPAGSHAARRTLVIAPATQPTFDASLFVPIVLSQHGAAGSFYTSEMALTNRGTTDARVVSTFTDADGGAGLAVAEDRLLAGQQVVIPDVIAQLRERGAALAAGDHVGTLGIIFSGLSSSAAAAATVRTTTAVREGRAGLAYAGLPPPKLLSAPVYLAGLRQNTRDRSNVAVINAGSSSDGNVTLRLTVLSGDPANPKTLALPDITLPPGGFNQTSGILGSNGLSLTNGYVRVERISGTAPFYAYGVINDQANSDGSFVEPVPASPATAITGLTLPVVVETSALSTELVVANLSATPRTVHLSYVASALASGSASLDLPLQANEQQILPGFVQVMRDRGAIAGAAGPTFAGALFATDASGDLRGISIGARTSSAGGGGRYGLFYSAVPAGSEAKTTAWLYGLQQNAENRTNLAIVNVGLVDASSDVFRIDLFDGATGQKAGSTEVTVPAKGFLQLNAILATYAPNVASGYALITRTSGNNPFVPYAVVNDGGQAGERSGDGAFVEMTLPATD
jgi:hypothetical protein